MKIKDFKDEYYFDKLSRTVTSVYAEIVLWGRYPTPAFECDIERVTKAANELTRALNDNTKEE